MLSNIVYIDEHNFDADRPFKIALSTGKSIDKLKVSFKHTEEASHKLHYSVEKILILNSNE